MRAKGLCAAVTIRARFTGFCRRLRRDADKGSAAVEFAMVAPVFFLILMATIESGVIFFAQSVLQNAVNDTARLVRTGQTACFSLNGGKCTAMNADQFRAKVCNEVSTLLSNCSADANGNSDLQFDVKAYPSGFTGVSNSSPLNAGQDLPNMTSFDVGNACDVVLVRAFYKWPVFTPGLSFLLGNMAGGKHLLATAAAFRNEPYTTTTGGC
jgi:Flp pilus assembly protein TadG